jgi:hypothetical protein
MGGEPSHRANRKSAWQISRATRNLAGDSAFTPSNGIALMDKLQFILPIRIVTEWAAPVKEVYSVEEALAFLDNYPKGRKSPLYQRAVSSCFAASAGEDSADNARKAFVAFSRMMGILAKDSVGPAWSDRSDDSFKPLVN